MSLCFVDELVFTNKTCSSINYKCVMEKCNKLIRREFLGSGQTWGKSSNVLKNTLKAFARKMDTAEEFDSIWLFNILNMIGVNDEYRKTCQQDGIMKEILDSFERKDSFYFMGISVEGTIVPGEIYDVDAIQCFEYFPVVEHFENIDKTDKMQPSLLIVKELDTPAGYVKLQVVMGDKPYISKHWDNLRHSNIDLTLFTVDKLGRIVLFDLSKFTPYFRRTKNKPAMYPEHKYCKRLDWVISYRCRQWPTCANEWLIRKRLYGGHQNLQSKSCHHLDFLLSEKAIRCRQK